MHELYLEVNPVHRVPNVLEHALVGHEEVAVLEARFTARGGGGKRDMRTAVGQAISLQRVFKNMTFVSFCLLLNGIAFPCWRVPSQTGKHSPPKRPTTRFQRTKDMQPFQITLSKEIKNQLQAINPPLQKC